MYVLVSASDSFSSRLNTGAQCKWGSVFYWLIFSSCHWCWVFIVIEFILFVWNYRIVLAYYGQCNSWLCLLLTGAQSA